MRLLNTKTFDLVSSTDPAFLASPTYAILSHRWTTWLAPEITFSTLPQDRARIQDYSQNDATLTKIRGACATARQHKLQWLWIDSCCIDRENGEEVAEALGEMGRWYANAALCLVYLYDVAPQGGSVSGPGIFRRSGGEARQSGEAGEASASAPAYSEWFTRGWCLQELLTPTKLEFFDNVWNYLGTRTELAKPLESVTSIEAGYLTGVKDFRAASIATKMSWMAGRQCSLIEDMAYSMLGLFDVQLAPRYGEGRKAFLRLQQELVRKRDESLYAWNTPAEGLPTPTSTASHTGPTAAWERDEWGLLAPSPSCFASCADITVLQSLQQPRVPPGFQVLPQGVKFPLPQDDVRHKSLNWIPVVGALDNRRTQSLNHVTFTLNCWKSEGPKAKPKAVQIHLAKVAGSSEEGGSSSWKRVRCSELSLTGGGPGKSEKVRMTLVLQPEIDP